MENERQERNLQFQDKHDPIYFWLDSVPNWTVYGHLSLKENLQWSEKERLKKFHLLIRDAAKRFTGQRDLDGLGWFLREEGNARDKRYHFHFALTDDNLKNTAPEVVCRYLTKQWAKIGKSVCQIEPWNEVKTAQGIWYLTQIEDYPVKESNYFSGDTCRWRMSKLLKAKIRKISTERKNP